VFLHEAAPGLARKGGHGDPSTGRLESEGRRAGGRDTDRAPAVTGMGGRHHAARHGRGCTSRGAAGRVLTVPGVACRAAHRGLGDPHDPELWRVGLTQYLQPCRLVPISENRVAPLDPLDGCLEHLRGAPVSGPNGLCQAHCIELVIFVETHETSRQMEHPEVRPRTRSSEGGHHKIGVTGLVPCTHDAQKYARSGLFDGACDRHRPVR